MGLVIVPVNVKAKVLNKSLYKTKLQGKTEKGNLNLLGADVTLDFGSINKMSDYVNIKAILSFDIDDAREYLGEDKDETNDKLIASFMSQELTSELEPYITDTYENILEVSMDDDDSFNVLESEINV